MNEQTRIRLGIIASRYNRRVGVRADTEQDWLADFDTLCAGVLRTAMTEIGNVLACEGHSCEVRLGTDPEVRGIDWVIEPRGLPEARRMIRLFARKDERKGWEVLAEIWFSGTPCELTRFGHPKEVTAEVAEHLFVDAVEQVLASAASG